MPTLISRRSNKLSKSGRYWVSTKPVIQWLLSRVTQWAGRAGSESDGRHSQYLEIACQPTLWRATVKISIQLKCCVLCVKTQPGNLILKYFKFGFMMMNWFTVSQPVASQSVGLQSSPRQHLQCGGVLPLLPRRAGHTETFCGAVSVLTGGNSNTHRVRDY